MKHHGEHKQKIFFISGIILLIIIYFAIIFSGLANIKKYTRQIPQKRAEYKEMLKLSGQFAQIKGQKITNLDSPPLTYLENKILSLNLSENLVSIRPEAENESEIEAKFENLSGNNAVKLLYEIQKLPFSIEQLALKDYEFDNLWTLKLVVKQIK